MIFECEVVRKVLFKICKVFESFACFFCLFDVFSGGIGERETGHVSYEVTDSLIKNGKDSEILRLYFCAWFIV